MSIVVEIDALDTQRTLDVPLVDFRRERECTAAVAKEETNSTEFSGCADIDVTILIHVACANTKRVATDSIDDERHSEGAVAVALENIDLTESVCGHEIHQPVLVEVRHRDAGRVAALGEMRGHGREPSCAVAEEYPHIK